MTRIAPDRSPKERLLRLALAGMVATLTLLGSGVPAQAARGCFQLRITITGSSWITGTPGDDVILGSSGNDTIDGMGGNDTICGGAGDDIISTRSYGAGYINIQFDGGPGNDFLAGVFPEGGSTNLILGGSGDDRIDGGVFADNTLAGGDGNDRITAADAAVNHVDGGDGNDTILGGYGSKPSQGRSYDAWNWLDGGPGDDILVGGLGEPGAQTENQLQGGVGADHLTAGDYATNLLDAGRDGDEDVCVHSQIGSDTFIGCDIEQ